MEWVNCPSLKCFLRLSMSRSGSVLVVVLVSASGILVAGYSTLHLMMASIREAETAISSQQMASLVGQINSLLKNERSCRLSLGGPLVDCPAGSDPSVCPAPSTDRATAKPINPTINPSSPIESPVEIFQPPDSNGVSHVLFSTASPKNKFGHLTITKLAITPVAPLNGTTDRYLAKLNIVAEKSAGLIGANETFSGDQMLTIRVRAAAPNNLISCSATTQEVGSSTVPLPSCVPGQILSSGSGQMTCITVMCPSGTTRSSTPNNQGNYTCT